MTKDLFDTSKLKKKKLNPIFEQLKNWIGSKAANSMLNDAYQTYADNDGNFLEQFQTTGFNPRFFELYLHTYLSRSGFTFLPQKDFPDFLVSKNDLTVAIEATTVNPSGKKTKKKPISKDKYGSEAGKKEMYHHIDNTVPIQFGSPLFSKLKKKYWEKEPCKDIPLVFAIEAFHEEDASSIPYGSVAQYLYGSKVKLSISSTGAVSVSENKITEHKDGDKVIPSNFFGQPDTEHISAVLFTNNGLYGKFSRMGMLHGYAADDTLMYREGHWMTPDPSAIDSTPFLYSQNSPGHVETWGEGLVVMHNPNALHPIPTDYFPDSFNITCDDNGKLSYFLQEHYPLFSNNNVLYVGEGLKKIQKLIPPVPNFQIRPISKKAFDTIRRQSIPSGAMPFEEIGHYIDSTESFLGVICLDKIDQLYCPMLLARDKNFIFRPIESDTEFKTRDHARAQLMEWFFKKLHHPQRIFDFE